MSEVLITCRVSTAGSPVAGTAISRCSSVILNRPSVVSVGNPPGRRTAGSRRGLGGCRGHPDARHHPSFDILLNLGPVVALDLLPGKERVAGNAEDGSNRVDFTASVADILGHLGVSISRLAPITRATPSLRQPCLRHNLLPLLTSQVEGGTLILGKKPNIRIQTTKPITYTLTMKDISGVAVSGSGTIIVRSSPQRRCVP